MVEQKLNNCLNCIGKYSVAYIDIDNFKAYNDVYGFENGDLVIKLLASVLRENISKEHFIGHIGGDDFVVIIYHHIAESYFEVVMKQFEQGVLKFYNQSDIMNGYITAANRRGEIEHAPLLSLTSVVINSDMQNFKDVYELTELLAKKKRDAKQNKLSAFLTIINKK